MPENVSILYVEDNPDNRMLIRRILQAEGYSLIEADSAKQTFEVLKTHVPSLILMDINMPDLDGYTITTQIRKLPNLIEVPIVALTANVMRGDRERSLAAGCNGYIQKPIDVDQFLAIIRKYLSYRST